MAGCTCAATKRYIALAGREAGITRKEILMGRSLAGPAAALVLAAAPAAEPIKLGIIGLDTSHAPEFARLFNDPQAAPDIAGFRVVAAYPAGSPDIAASARRVPQ